jgi:hypothetical protein
MGVGMCARRVVDQEPAPRVAEITEMLPEGPTGIEGETVPGAPGDFEVARINEPLYQAFVATGLMRT